MTSPQIKERKYQYFDHWDEKFGPKKSRKIRGSRRIGARKIGGILYAYLLEGNWPEGNWPSTNESRNVYELNNELGLYFKT